MEVDPSKDFLLKKSDFLVNHPLIFKGVGDYPSPKANSLPLKGVNGSLWGFQGSNSQFLVGEPKIKLHP